MRESESYGTKPGRLRLGLLALALAVAGALLLLPGDVNAASFNPTLEVTLSDTNPGASPDITSKFGLPKGDSNFAGVIGFTPPEMVPAAVVDLPLGAMVGTLETTAVLGLLNGACAQNLPFQFTFFNASTDNSPGNLITPPPVFQPDGTATPDRLKLLAGDADGNFIRDGIEKYPSFLNDLFGGLKPRARFMGYTSPPYRPDISLTVALQFVLFDPGTQFDPNIPVDPRLGYPSVTVLLDPSVAATKSAVTDFCTPLQPTTTTFGISQDNPATPSVNEGGTPVRKNPDANATINFVSFSISQRDSDDDGYENALDTCPYAANQLDARSATPPEGDNDGIDPSCDPDPNVPCWPGAPGTLSGGQLYDCDNDGWLNRGDNCPQIANGGQEDADSDAIGDVCDQNPNTPDGHNHAVCTVVSVNIGAGGTPAVDPQTLAPCNPSPTAAEAAVASAGQSGSTAGTQAAGGQSSAQSRGGASAAGGPSTGVGSLAPVAASVPPWAAITAALGSSGLFGLATRRLVGVFRRRR